jgi:hypothetical protein
LADGWAAVLEDLDARLQRAEAGDLAALDGFSAPTRQPVEMSAGEQALAAHILARQRALEVRLRADLARVAASMVAVRPKRPSWNAGSAPVYVDRSA